MSPEKPTELPPIEDIRSDLENEIRQYLNLRLPDLPSGVMASPSTPRLNPALIDLILQELPSLYAIIRRIVDSSKSSS